jgi:hypothetical protein
MMFSAQELLAKHGIAYVSTKKSSYTTNCPQCSGGYLNVKIERDRVAWFCHNCDEGSSESFERREASGDLGPIVATFDYTDEAGDRLFQVLKFEPPGRPKDFRQRKYPEQKPWSIKGVRIVPFRLPELIADIASEHVVFVVEGEKDVNTLRSHGAPATCNPMGAGKWWTEFNEILRGADVVICGDNDPPGRDHVKLVARHLHGVASRLRVLELKTVWPEIEESDDITAWFEAGGTVEKLWGFVEQLDEWRPSLNGDGDVGGFADNTIGAGTGNESQGSGEAPEMLLTTTAWWRDPETIPRRQFLYDRHYIRGTVSATIAAGGRAKTTSATYDALSMAIGRELAAGAGGQPLPAGPLRVGMLNAEEDQDELDRRLAATCQLYGITEADLGGRLFAQSMRKLNMRLVTMVKNVPTINSDAMTVLLAFVRNNRLDVLIIDPLVSFHRVSENDNVTMDLLIKDVFGSIAEQTSAAVELCHHSGKPKEGRSETAVEDSRGASAIIWAVRSARVLNFMTPEEAAKLGIAEDQRRLHIRVANGKANMGPLGKAVWMKLVVEILPNGDEIACASSWTPPNPFDGVTTADMELARNWSRTGAYRTDPRSPNWFGLKLADHLRLDVRCGDRGPEGAASDIAKVKQIIAQWLKNKVLATEERVDEHRKKRIFIVPGSYEPEPAPEAEDAF